MAKRPIPTADELRQLLEYDPDTGAFRWKTRPVEWFSHCSAGHRERICNSWNAAWAQKDPGRIDGYGYLIITVNHSHLRAHRIAWCITHGEWPSEQIDHINGDRADNRLSNLRASTHTENQRNMRRSRANTSGVTGVYWCGRTKRWKAEVTLRTGKIYVGVFRDIADAKAAVEAKRRALGFSERHGKSGRDFDHWRAASSQAAKP